MEKITLKEFMETIDYRITDGSEFLWHCYGENARSLEYWNEEHSSHGVSITCIFDTKTTEVYEMQAWDYSNNREYRWIHPLYLDSYKKECDVWNVDFETSCDDRKFIDLEVAEDILEKASAIFHGREYDTRVTIQLSMTEQEELLIMRAAHAKDMSVNQFIESILEAEIAKNQDNFS